MCGIMYDEDLFDSEQHATHFKSLIACASFDLHFWDKTSAVHYFNQYVLWALSVAFPKKLSVPAKPWISAYTVDCIHARSLVRSQFKAAQDPIYKQFLHSQFKSYVKWVCKSIV